MTNYRSFQKTDYVVKFIKTMFCKSGRSRSRVKMYQNKIASDEGSKRCGSLWTNRGKAIWVRIHVLLMPFVMTFFSKQPRWEWEFLTSNQKIVRVRRGKTATGRSNITLIKLSRLANCSVQRKRSALNRNFIEKFRNFFMFPFWELSFCFKSVSKSQSLVYTSKVLIKSFGQF